MEVGGGGDDSQLRLVEPEQIGVADEVVAVGVVVCVGEEGADVVQLRGPTQQLALPAVEVMQPARARAVEKRHGQPRDVGGVALVEVADASQPQHALRAHGELLHRRQRLGAQQVVTSRPSRSPRALACTTVQLQLLHQRFQHGGAGDDDVRAVGIDAGHFAPFLQRQRTEHCRHLAEA